MRFVLPTALGVPLKAKCYHDLPLEPRAENHVNVELTARTARGRQLGGPSCLPNMTMG